MAVPRCSARSAAPTYKRVRSAWCPAGRPRGRGPAGQGAARQAKSDAARRRGDAGRGRGDAARADLDHRRNHRVPRQDSERRVLLGLQRQPRVSDGALRIAAKGAIANDAGIAKNSSAVEGVLLLGERGVPAASVATLSARLGEGSSTWDDGVISVVNPPAVARGVKIGMTAKEAARLMVQATGR